MAMRITTKMMQNTSLRNLNTNKARQEMLTTQLSTGKKISRPSDDPVIAIRSLKLNSSLDKIDQYYEKNAEDAESWLELTASALSTVNGILESDIRPNINQAVSSYQEYKERQAIMEHLQNAVQEIYATGNADSAGRSIFTGYRTDLPLSFTEDKTETYFITEQLTNSSISKTTYVKTGVLTELNEGNFADASMNTTEYDVGTYDIYRIRLAYGDTDVVTAKTDADGNPVVDDQGAPVYEPDITLAFGDFSQGGVAKTYSVNPVYDGNGNKISEDITFFAGGTEEAYMTAVNDPDAIVYIADTGELLLGQNVKETLSKLSADTELRISYEKTNWSKGDLDPVHYFYTERTQETTGRTLKYNENFLDGKLTADSRQIIEYDIGNNQTIRVNTTADEVFDHDIGRDVEEVVSMLEQYGVLDETYTTIEDMIDSGKYLDEDLTKLEEHLAALEKAMTMVGDKITNRCGELLTECDKYMKQATLAETNCGSRGSRLKLIQNRLSVQQTNFGELVSENEDADYTDLAIQLKSVEMTYEAALSSISYVMQTTLLDFI